MPINVRGAFMAFPVGAVALRVRRDHRRAAMQCAQVTRFKAQNALRGAGKCWTFGGDAHGDTSWTPIGRTCVIQLSDLRDAGSAWRPDRKSVVWGKSVSVRVEFGGRR